MQRGDGQRGQTLPVWAFGSLSILLLLFYMLDYANAIRWQMRAQNAADAAAAGALSIQASQWNEMLMNLHASAVEEFRLRRTLDGMLLVLNGKGGCTNSQQAYPAGTGQTDCAKVYENLRANFMASLQRYGNDVAQQQAVQPMSQTQLLNEMQNLIAQYQANGCKSGSNSGGDCAFSYTLTGSQLRNDSYLEDVEEDAGIIIVGGGTSGAPKADLTPEKVEVVACANVKPLIPAFFYLNAGTFRAVGRSAATTIQVTQEWMDPGHYTNPLTGKLFQPTEYPDAAGSLASSPFGSANYDWYSTEFGGNSAQAFPVGEKYVETDGNDEFEVMTGWWASIPMHPFMGTLTYPGSYTCK